MKRPILIPVLVAGLMALGAIHSWANPAGGQVSAGSASINTVPGTVTVNQFSDKAVINWQTFSINSGELTKFVQPTTTSAALNRVLGGQTSFINGTLSANGQIYLINGNGILVGPGGMVNAHSFIASTRDINDNDFLAGKLHFTGSSPDGVQNLGTINALGGDVYLIGKTVDNQGSITAAKGTVGLASGDDVLLNQGGQEHVFVNPSASASSAPAQTAIHNSGSITAAQAELKAANGNLFALAINNEGVIRATSVAHHGGRIFLTTDAGSIQNNGTLAAKKGLNGGQVKITGGSVWNTSTVDVAGAKGGSVTVNSKNFENDGTISAKGTAGAGGSVAVAVSGNALGASGGLIDASGSTQGGSIQFEGTGATSMEYLSLSLDVSSSTGAGGEVQLNSPTLYLTGASINASGATQGGRIFLGKDDPTSVQATTNTAKTVYVSTGTSLLASATSTGNGGQISTHSSGSTQFLGYAEAKGGPNGGDGGLIEVSGATATYFGGNANASAPGGGKAGTFLLDPKYIIVAQTSATGSGFEFVDPDPGPNNSFGSDILNITGNTTLITSPGDSFGGTGAGAVYLFSDTNGALISSLRGSHANDAVGTTVDDLSNGNALIITTTWNSNTGAVTFFNGTTGVNGAVSASNSLVGVTPGDEIGSGGLTALYEDSDPNYLIYSPLYQGAGGTATNAGAVTFITDTTAVVGVVGVSNSLVGSASGDKVGSGGITLLNEDGSYNYVVSSPLWDGDKGAVTYGSGTSGVSGAVSSVNSLVGLTAGDEIGSGGISTIDENNSYNYLVYSPLYQGSSGTATDAGAVTFGSGTSGVHGVIGAGNSLVGSAANDRVGYDGITELYENGSFNYVVSSPYWSGNLGAVTLGSGATGISGAVSSGNSLVGVTAGDEIGSGGITTIDEGNNYDYLVYSPLFQGIRGSATNAGAVTWGSGTSGVSGAISASNSLVGSTANDQVGSGGITQLYENGTYNYVVSSPYWSGDLGAVTFANGSTGVVGAVSSANSLVGFTAGDEVGSGGITTLSEGAYTNYLVYSPLYQGANGSDANTGAVTWGNGSTTGVSGVISASNSLVGSHAGDAIGSDAVFVLQNSSGYNYLVVSPQWSSNTGAVTFGNGTSGITGVVSSSNSFVGLTSGDEIGSGDIETLYQNGTYNYLILSPNFQGLSGYAPQAGAVTWGSGTSALTGVISATNSLMGSSSDDQIGSGGIDELYNSGGYNYVVVSPNWNGGVGAVTFGNGATGISGVVSSANSLVGLTSGDNIGSGGVTTLYSGGNYNYLILSPNFQGLSGSATSAGAVTWGSGTSGVSGVISASNSLVGSNGDDEVGGGGITLIDQNDGYNYVVSSPNWNGGTGAVTWGNGGSGVSGVVSSSNSLVGLTAGDKIGSGGITTLYENGVYNYLVSSPNYQGCEGTETNVGAVTFGDGSTGISGVISESNSLVGTSSNDDVGGGGIFQLSNGNYIVLSSSWNGGEGAVTFGNGMTGISGKVSSGNSLVGSTGGDDVGSGGITSLYENGNYNYLVSSPLWSSSTGAVTFGSGTSGVSGVVSSTNSLVGSTGGDEVGSGGITTLYENGGYNYLVNSPLWSSNTGAVTFGSGLTGVSGFVSSANSLVGAASGDRVGSSGSEQVYDSSSGVYNYVVMSPYWNNSAGAATWGSGTSGVTGVVGTSNSITGGSSNAGLTFSGYAANDTLFVISFRTDTSAGGDGRVYASSVANPTSSAPSIDPNTLTYADSPGSSVTISASSITAITNAGTDVVLQANSDITVNQAILTDAPSNLGGNLTFDAGRSIIINADITTDNGNLTLLANDPNALAAYRDPGLANIMQSNSTLNLGTGAFQATIAGGANAGDIALDTVNAGTVDVSDLDPGNVTLGGVISATNTSIDAGDRFTNHAGPNAITGQWNIYSASPYGDSFGGLASNNLAVFGATPTSNVGAGNHYLFALTPTLSVVALSRDKITGTTIDYTSPQVGVDYTVLGFVPAASFGNVFLQDTAANTLTGSPDISSLGAAASATPGIYPIELTQGTLELSRSGFNLTFPSSVNGVSPEIQVGNFFDDNSGNPVSEQVAAFANTGLNNLPVVSQFYVYDPSIETFVPVTVGETEGGAINDGNGHNVTKGSSTADAPGPNRLVVPGNGIWNIFGGLVHSVPPPPFVVQQFQLNLNPTVYANMHHYVFGN